MILFFAWLLTQNNDTFDAKKKKERGNKRPAWGKIKSGKAKTARERNFQFKWARRGRKKGENRMRRGREEKELERNRKGGVCERTLVSSPGWLNS